jgi:perosamine synthetase
MKDLFSDHIPFLKPWLGKEEEEAVLQVIRSGWVSSGPKVEQFEKAIAKFVGAKYGIATNSCTSALHLSLRLSQIGLGDEVICPSFTCMATANAIHHVAAKPIFVDIEEKTFNLDPNKIGKAITKKTKAIMLVHQIGLAADIDAFKAIAKKYKLVLIQDAATALGGKYKKVYLGGDDGLTSYSFHPRKIITTGEGGMIVTNNFKIAELARNLRSAGASISDLVRHKAKGTLVQKYFTYGYNYRMTDMQAAIGLVQMQKINKILKERTRQAKEYDKAFADTLEIIPPFVPSYATHAYSSYMIRIKSKKISRDEVLKVMAKNSISCRIGIQPLHFEPFYRKIYGKSNLPVTEKVASDSMFLPIFPGLTKEQQNKIISTLKRILTK